MSTTLSPGNALRLTQPICTFLCMLTASAGLCQMSGEAVYQRIYYGKENSAYTDTLHFDGQHLRYIEHRFRQQWWTAEGYRITVEPRHQHWYLDTRTLRTFEVVFHPGTQKTSQWDDQAQPIRWIIHESFKNIGNYRAQKAETVIRHPLGDYTATAWFTTSIPIGAGPCRFWGLPGLILELHEDNLSYMTLTSLEWKPVGDLTTEGSPNAKTRKKLSAPRKKELQQILQKDGF